jgi:hypothetical protein
LQWVGYPAGGKDQLSGAPPEGNGEVALNRAEGSGQLRYPTGYREREFLLRHPDGAGILTSAALEIHGDRAVGEASISGGTGDADLFIRRGALPLEFTYDCRPLRQGNEETCTVTSPAEGYWYIMLRGHVDFAGVSLVATVDG